MVCHVQKENDMNAQQMLDAARASNPGQTYGTVTHAGIIVSWCRPTQTYDVGTAATSRASGRRAEVMPTLVALLAEAIR